MTFPNGYRGVKKVFVSEILSLISSILLIAAGAIGIAAVGTMLNGDLDGSLVAAGGVGIITIIAMILMIIAMIFKLIGLHQAGKDDESFRTAFLVAIFALILAVVSAILSAIFGQSSVADDIVGLVQRIANIAVIFLCINGIQTFAVRLNYEKLVSRGNKIAWVIAIPYFLAAIAALIAGIGGFNETTSTISGVMTLIGGILGAIGSILFLVYLGQGKTMLRDN